MAPPNRVDTSALDDENVAPTTNTATAKVITTKRYATRATTRRALTDVANRAPAAEKRAKDDMKKVKVRQDGQATRSTRTRAPPPDIETVIIPTTLDGIEKVQIRMDTLKKESKSSSSEKHRIYLELEKLPEGVEDIDANDVGDTLTEYSHAVTVHRTLLLREHNLLPPSNYLEGRDITGQMRRILVDWLVDVHAQFGLSTSTLHLTVNILDRFLAITQVTKSRLQLAGVASAWLASKYEEVYPPSLADFVYIADGTYTAEEVERMEATILNTLEWRLTVATMPPFALRSLKALRIGGECLQLITYFTDYVLELALCDADTLVWRPSLVAAASVALAAHLLATTPVNWDATLQFHSGGYDIEDLTDCVLHIWDLVQRDAPKNAALDAVNRKYSSSRFGKIAEVAATLELDAIHHL